MTAPWLGGALLSGVKLYHLAEMATVLLVLMILFGAIGILLLMGSLLWKAGKGAIGWARRAGPADQMRKAPRVTEAGRLPARGTTFDASSWAPLRAATLEETETQADGSEAETECVGHRN